MSMQAPTQQSSFGIGGPTRRSLLIVALAVACSAGCDGSDRSTAEATTASEIKVFRYSMNGAPTSLDPVQTRSVYANFVVLNAFDTLYSYKYLARDKCRVAHGERVDELRVGAGQSNLHGIAV